MDSLIYVLSDVLRESVAWFGVVSTAGNLTLIVVTFTHLPSAWLALLPSSIAPHNARGMLCFENACLMNSHSVEATR